MKSLRPNPVCRRIDASGPRFRSLRCMGMTTRPLSPGRVKWRWEQRWRSPEKPARSRARLAWRGLTEGSLGDFATWQQPDRDVEPGSLAVWRRRAKNRRYGWRRALLVQHLPRSAEFREALEVADQGFSSILSTCSLASPWLATSQGRADGNPHAFRVPPRLVLAIQIGQRAEIVRRGRRGREGTSARRSSRCRASGRLR